MSKPTKSCSHGNYLKLMSFMKIWSAKKGTSKFREPYLVPIGIKFRGWLEGCSWRDAESLRASLLNLEIVA